MATSYYNPWVGPDYWGMLREGYRLVDVPIESHEITTDGKAIDSSTTIRAHQATDRTAIGAIGVGTSVGRSIGNAVGGYLEARGKASALRSQAAVSEANARVMQFGVEQAFRAGEAQVAAIGLKQAETKAAQRNAFAANGVAVGVGSTAEVMASTDLQAAVDKMTAKQNALAQAWGYRRQRMMSIAQAEGQRVMASATSRAGRVGMYAGLASAAMGAWAGFSGV